MWRPLNQLGPGYTLSQLLLNACGGRPAPVIPRGRTLWGHHTHTPQPQDTIPRGPLQLQVMDRKADDMGEETKKGSAQG